MTSRRVRHIPVAARRPWLLTRSLWVDRDHPRLTYLRGLSDPERFCWAILPHAARSFALSILLLPEPQARTAAVGYLYARALDTYEDLSPDPAGARAALEHFAKRLEAKPPHPARALPTSRAVDDRDRVHLLLVERCELVDRVYEELPASDQTQIRELVQDMARGMVWASQTFESQGGVLTSTSQLQRYCHVVIGLPSVFVMKLLLGRPLTTQEVADAMQVSELIQLANITRDIEKDLARGVAYHPALRSHLAVVPTGETEQAVLQVRRELVSMALRRVPTYRRLVEEVGLPRVSAARAAAVLMLAFTDLHYRNQAARADLPRWTGPPGKVALVLGALPASISPGWATSVMRRIERDFLATAALGETGPPG